LSALSPEPRRLALPNTGGPPSTRQKRLVAPSARITIEGAVECQLDRSTTELGLGLGGSATCDNANATGSTIDTRTT
jgi:hypothetical protein